MRFTFSITLLETMILLAPWKQGMPIAMAKSRSAIPLTCRVTFQERAAARLLVMRDFTGESSDSPLHWGLHQSLKVPAESLAQEIRPFSILCRLTLPGRIPLDIGLHGVIMVVEIHTQRQMSECACGSFSNSSIRIHDFG
jgi:hypothetical protein